MVGSNSFHRSFLGGHESIAFNIETYDDDTRFISATRRGPVAAWDISTAQRLWRSDQDSGVFALAVRQGKAFIGRQDGKIKILDLTDG